MSVQTVADIAADTQVWLGPCIGPTAFEVGSEVRQAFVTASAQAASCFTPGAVSGKWWANLPGLARQRLQALGLTGIYGNDGSTPWCTVTDSTRFSPTAVMPCWAARDDACIWLEGQAPAARS
jgi:copper oxidase (laccase) domain-containing protein